MPPQPSRPNSGKPSSSCQVFAGTNGARMPGSSSRSSGFAPRKSMSTLGAKSASGTIAIESTRAVPRGDPAMPTINSTTAAGISTGAQASATAASSEAVPAQLHDSRARVAASSSHGNTTARTRVGSRPALIEPSSTGLRAHASASSARPAEFLVSWAAQIQPPSDASGIAVTSMSTTPCDGFQNVRVPSRASTQVKGSAGTPSAVRVFAQSSPRGLSGASAPPVRLIWVMAHQVRAIVMSTLASSTARPPDEMKCSSSRRRPCDTRIASRSIMRAVRTVFGSTRSGFTAPQPELFASRTLRRDATTDPGVKNTLSADENSPHMLPGCSRMSAQATRSTASRGRPSHMKNAAIAGA